MPPARPEVHALVETYLKRHPAERAQLEPLLASLDAEADPTSRATLPSHITCSAVVIDRNRRVLHIHHRAGGLVPAPGGHVEPDDRTVLATALRKVSEEAGIKPGDLCLSPQFLDAPIDIDVHDIDADPRRGEPEHRHFDLRFVFYVAHSDTEIALQDEEVSGADWRSFEQVGSPTLRAKLLKADLDGRPEPVTASVLVYDDTGRYLLHLRDNYPDISEPGTFALLGGGREPGDPSLEATIHRELAEEVPGLHLSDLEPFAVEETTGVDGMCVPIQTFAGRWNGNPDTLQLNEGVLLHWFPLGMLHRLRLPPSTAALLQRHAAQRSSQTGPPDIGETAPPYRDLGSPSSPGLVRVPQLEEPPVRGEQEGGPTRLPPEQYAETVLKATAFACVYFTDEEDRPLQLHSVYSPTHPWQFVGGTMDPGERPWQTAVRECREETGITPPGPARLLASVYSLPGAEWPYSTVGLVFDGGRLTEEQIRGIALDPDEHDEARVLPLQEWEPLMPPRDFARLSAVMEARRTGTAAYFDTWDWGNG
ncbi:NUDIX hydrolase [Streptomyces colonosanans]|uniref:NUDIX hydrolase n=1 Tax=Streptomyces colonosanans TaxID=1428652 RepID=UPI000B1660A4|nr:NUDIX hydrolase [Streptomyces colonosanans]